MKRKMFLLIVGISLCLLGACEDPAKSGNTYTVDKAVKDGHVVAENKSDKQDQISQGAVKTHNLKKLFEFNQNIEDQKEDQLKVTIFNQDGSAATSTLKYDGGDTIQFDNHYKGYSGMYDRESPTGKFQCEEIFISEGAAELQACVRDDGKKYDYEYILIGEEDKFKKLESEGLR